ncbi:TlpA disulfide reductase family protein [Hymenobacter nivis]|uniref:Alkyl hydroperoxide reductase n=1 Tax=Hymenobacter nivis TaxID=1850093 RepID=A0A2Z3GNY0_9BACT|nr:TlpA disulfide reductase family protein [Hymenobacter nivis]AWM33377.1 alkyl hydroperoxide reductase [Hymenobacter nivis]
MKKHLLSCLLLAPGLALAQTSFPFTIKGKIGNLNAPAKVYLMRGLEPADSATFKDGAFELKGTADAPKKVDLILKRDGKLGNGMYGMVDRTQVFLEPGPVVLTSPDSLFKARVTGGPVAADDQRLQVALKPIYDKRKVVGAEIRKASMEERRAPAFAARMQGRFDVLNKEDQQVQQDFIKANPSSWVSLNALTNLMSVPQYAVVAPLYEGLSPALQASPEGRQYGEMLRGLKEVAIGAQAPNFSQKTPAGKLVSLTDYRGKYVLIDFWASWCKPCRQENPAVVKVYEAYKGRNFDILGVSLDSENSREKWMKAIQDDHLPWTQVSDLRGGDNAVAQTYHVQSIPQNFLIDPSGKIVATNLRGEELQTVLAKFIK